MEKEPIKIEIEIIGEGTNQALRVYFPEAEIGTPSKGIALPFSPEELDIISWILGFRHDKKENFSQKTITLLSNSKWGVLKTGLSANEKGGFELEEKDIDFGKLISIIQKRLRGILFYDKGGAWLQNKLKQFSMNEVVHIMLQIPAGGDGSEDNVQLFRYPWELLSDDTPNNELWGYKSVSFSRYIKYDGECSQLQHLEERDILIVAPRPKDKKLGREEDDQYIVNGLKKASENVKCTVIDSMPKTYEELINHLNNRKLKQPTILHFAGHGVFGRCCPKHRHYITTAKNQEYCTMPECSERLPQRYTWYFAFEDGNHSSYWVSSDELAETLKSYEIQIVVLNTCESASARREQDVFNGAAQSLIRKAGIPIVVATAFPVDWEGAARFAKSFYQALGDKEPIEAMQEARRFLKASKDIKNEWYRYVLYMRVAENAKETKASPRIIHKGVNATQIDKNLNCFKNRVKKRDKLKKFLFDKNISGPIAIEGPPGIGKSALTANLLKTIKEEWSSIEGFRNDSQKFSIPERVIFICLHRNEGSNGIRFDKLFEYCIEELSDEKKEQLMKRSEDLESLDDDFIDLFLGKLDDGFYIIILDNMEDFIIKGDIYRDVKLKALIESSKKFDNIKFIITTYKDLSSSGKKIHLMKGLSPEDSFHLFKSLVEGQEDYLGLDSVLKNYSESKQVPSELKNIFRCVENIPLGIEFIVEILEAWPQLRLSELEKELEDIFKSKCHNLLQETYSPQDAFESKVVKTLEKLVKKVFDSLSDKEKEEERMIIKILSVFEDGASYKAIHDILKHFNENSSEENIKGKLSKPSCRTFLAPPDDGKVKFQYDIYRKYAYSLIEFEKKTGSKFTREALEGYAAQCRHLESLNNSECKHDLLLQAARHYKNAGDYDFAARMLSMKYEFSKKGLKTPLCEYLRIMGKHEDIRELLEDFVLEENNFPIKKIDNISQMDILIELGLIYKNAGEFGDETNVDSINPQLDDGGRLIFLSGKPDGAINCFKIALRMAQKNKKLKRESICRHNLGNCYGHLGKIDKAIKELEEALQTAQNAFTDKERGIAYHNLGKWYAYQGNDAINREKLLQEKLEQKSALGKAAEKISKNLNKYSGKTVRKSKIFLEAANNLFYTLKEEACQANTLIELGHICFDRYGEMKEIQQKDFEHLKKRYEKAFRLAREVGYRQIQYEACCGIATTCLFFGKNVDDDFRYIAEAKKLYEESSLKFKTYKAQILDGIVKLKQENINGATESFKQAIKDIDQLLARSQNNIDALYHRCLALYSLKLYSPDKPNEWAWEADDARDALHNQKKNSGVRARMSKLFGILGDNMYLEKGSFEPDC